MGFKRRFVARQCTRHALGDNEVVVRARGSGERHITSKRKAALLMACDTFETLEDHCTWIQRQLGLSDDATRVVLRELESLSQSELVIRASSIRRSPRSPVQPIETLGIVTGNRPALSRRALRSYLDNVRRSGRSIEVVVADDTRSRDERSAFRRDLGKLSGEYGQEIRYMGLEEKKNYVEILAEKGIAADTAAYALTNLSGVQWAAGANRNCLHLDTLGRRVISSDDDLVCSMAPHPDQRDSVIFTGGDYPMDMWYFASTKDAFAFAQPRDADFVGSFSSALGQSLQGLASSDAVEFMRCPTALVELLEVDGSVGIVTSGLVGDCAHNTPLYAYLFVEGDSRSRLHATEAHFRACSRSRALFRAPPATTITNKLSFASFLFAIDNSQGLPPCPPVSTDEDVLFGNLLRWCNPGWALAQLPWAVRHQPPTERHFGQADLEGTFGTHAQLELNQLLRLVTLHASESTAARNLGAGLRALGRRLGEYVTCDRRDLELLISDLRCAAVSATIARYRAVQSRYAGEPGYWNAHMQKNIANRVAALRDPPNSPLHAAMGTRRTSMQTLSSDETVSHLRSWGNLLETWPDILQAVKDLGAAGIRMSTIT